MKCFTVLKYTMVMVALCCLACMKGPDTKNCILSTGSLPAPANGNLVYSIAHSHNAFLRSLTYHGLHGPVKIDTPKLPFTITLSVPQGMAMGIHAEGTAIEGHLAARYVFTSTSETIIKGDTCKK